MESTETLPLKVGDLVHFRDKEKKVIEYETLGMILAIEPPSKHHYLTSYKVQWYDMNESIGFPGYGEDDLEIVSEYR